MLLPPELFAKVWSALNSLKAFVEQRKAGASIFRHESTKQMAQKWHEAKVSIAGDSIRFAVTLFGKETWKSSFRVLENGLPAALDDFELTVRNDFSDAEKKAARLSLNGKDWIPSYE